MSHPDTAPEEEALEPDLRICDPHMHIMREVHETYDVADHLRDTGRGHRVVASMHVENRQGYRDGGPEHLKPVGEVEMARRVHDETRGAHTWMARGVVGFVDLTEGAQAEDLLDAEIEAGAGALKGVRQVQSWDDTGSLWSCRFGPNLYAREDFRAGLAALTRRGLSLDTWQYYHQLPALADLAGAFPDTAIMCDHTAGVVGVGAYAERREELFQTWRANLIELARRPNVWMKIGGLGMTFTGFDFSGHREGALSEAIAAAWRPYVESCIEAFGIERCMFESNYPADAPTCSYGTLWNAFKRIASAASDAEKARLFHDNAVAFYRLDAA